MNAQTEIRADAPPKLRGVHHTAFRCRDAEETRAFYETVLGLPMKAALASDDGMFLHLFFEFGDGTYLAFFDRPKGVGEDHFAMKDPFDLHYAMEVGTKAELLGFQARLNAAGRPCFGPLNHHFCHSIYFTDPNGLQLEITWRDPDHDAVMAAEEAAARRQLAEWTAAKAAG